MNAAMQVLAFVRRDWATARSYRVAFALQFVTLLLTLSISFYVGRLVDSSASPAAREHLPGGYFGFAVIGMSLLAILQTGITSFAMKLRQEQTTGTFEALMSTPASPSLLILSSAAYDLLRATVVGFVLLILSVIVFGLDLNTTVASGVAAVAALIACLGLFGAVGVSVAAFTVVFKQFTALLNLVVGGLTVLGGVYFPVEVMPPALRTLASVLPFTWALDVLRAALLRADIQTGRLAILAASAMVALPISLFLFRLALRRARRDGSLAHY
jgi:ABC-2 type transport system permease protein